MQPGAQNSTRTPVLLLGASIRAMAASAARAGFAPSGADLFGDRDTVEIASVTQIANYPDGLAAFASHCPSSNWAYTGGLENYPEIVERLSASHRLLGCDHIALGQLRSQTQLQQWAVKAGLHSSSHASPTEGQRWVAKSARGAGGLGVRFVDGHEPLREGERREPWIAGQPGSTSFLSYRGRVTPLGSVWQMSGSGAAPFVYAGSWGPARLEIQSMERLRQFADLVTAETNLTGLWGVDWVLDKSGSLNLLEINPRWTASMEVLEAAAQSVDSGLPPLFALHAAACNEGLPAVSQNLTAEAHRLGAALELADLVCGKRIVYAKDEIKVGDGDGWRGERTEVDTTWRLADVPSPHVTVSAGHPLCTILATAPSEKRLLEVFAASTKETPAILR